MTSAECDPVVETVEFVETKTESMVRCLHCLHLSPQKTSTAGRIFEKCRGYQKRNSSAENGGGDCGDSGDRNKILILFKTYPV
jgi:hypothetical protein